MTYEVQVLQPARTAERNLEMADSHNQYHVAAPSSGDLWVMYVGPGDIVKKGEELFNISIMKQEKAVSAPMDGIVKRVLKTADYKETKKMLPVREGELIIELGPVPRLCSNPACGQPLSGTGFVFCPLCGKRLE
jgi:pyruvate carboxylase